MKKTLLLASAAALSMSAFAAGSYKVYPDFVIQGLSEDGTYAVSTNPYTSVLAIFNTVTEKAEDTQVFIGDGYETEYTAGLGRCLSRDGVLVGSTTFMGTASYLKDGEWHHLSVPNPEHTNLAQGITPDGKVICGIIGNDSFSIDATNIMSLPAVWYLQDDGTYGEPVVLPYPEKDFTGRVPQSISAISISDDGKTVVGQVRDYRGAMEQPIVYTCNDKGEWSYTLLCPELINPGNVEFPEYPGESPRHEDFASEEEIAAYEEAKANWDGKDWSNYPYIDDFMSEEELAAFNEAHAAWWKKYEAFDNAYYEATAEGAAFEYNNVFLSPDGKYYVTSTVAPGGIWMSNKKDRKASPKDFDDFGEEEAAQATIYVIDIAAGTYKTYTSEKGLTASCVAADGTVLGTEDISGARHAVIIAPGAEDYQYLEDYFAVKDPAAAAWMDENCRHDIESMDWNTGEMVIEQNVMVSGTPYATPDLKKIGTFVENSWDYESPDAALYYTYLFTPADTPTTAVEDITDGTFAVKALAGGVIEVSGEAAHVTVYTLGGSKVYEGNAEGSVATGLAQGCYIVNATSKSGKTAVVKAAF